MQYWLKLSFDAQGYWDPETGIRDVIEDYIRRGCGDYARRTGWAPISTWWNKKMDSEMCAKLPCLFTMENW